MGHKTRASDAKNSMRIVWSPEALTDLADLREYIAQDNPGAARRIVVAIFNTVELVLTENPECGRPGRVPNTREMVIPKTPVIVPYRIHNAALEVLGIYHQARRWPDHF